MGDVAAETVGESMVEKVARNAPCPCGSGEKYKRCHGSDEALAAAASERAASPIGGLLRQGPWLVGLSGVVLGLIIMATHKMDIGLGVMGGLVLAGVAWGVFRDPPPPNTGSGDPAGLNFGR